MKYTWVYSESKLVYTYSSISMPLCWVILLAKRDISLLLCGFKQKIFLLPLNVLSDLI